jgi:hypothetical protein
MRAIDDKAYRISKVMLAGLVVTMLTASVARARSKMSQASLSPDGRTIAYTYYVDEYQYWINLYDVNTHRDTKLEIGLPDLLYHSKS